MRGLRDWADHCRSDHRLVVGDGGSIDRCVRVLWLEGTILVDAADVLTGTAAAASIAWINSLGNLGGFFGPWYVGVIKDWTSSYAGGLYGLAFLCVMSAVVCALFLHIPNPAVTRGRTAALAAE
jgi:nitrate/nitrite transporter NarK